MGSDTVVFGGGMGDVPKVHFTFTKANFFVFGSFFLPFCGDIEEVPKCDFS